MTKPKLPKWLPHQQKCDYTKCHKPALKENAVRVGNHFLFYCQYCFVIVKSDMKRPTGYPKDHKAYHLGMWPKPGYPKPAKKRSQQWNALTKSLFAEEKQNLFAEEKRSDKKNQRTKMPAWEEIQPKREKEAPA